MLCHYRVPLGLIRDLPGTNSVALFAVGAAVFAHCVPGAYVAVRSGVIVDVRCAFRNLKSCARLLYRHDLTLRTFGQQTALSEPSHVTAPREAGEEVVAKPLVAPDSSSKPD